MRKNKTLLTIFAILMIIAMMATILVGCDPEDEPPKPPQDEDKPIPTPNPSGEEISSTEAISELIAAIGNTSLDTKMAFNLNALIYTSLKNSNKSIYIDTKGNLDLEAGNGGDFSFEIYIKDKATEEKTVLFGMYQKANLSSSDEKGFMYFHSDVMSERYPTTIRLDEGNLRRLYELLYMTGGLDAIMGALGGIDVDSLLSEGILPMVLGILFGNGSYTVENGVKKVTLPIAITDLWGIVGPMIPNLPQTIFGLIDIGVEDTDELADALVDLLNKVLGKFEDGLTLDKIGQFVMPVFEDFNITYSLKKNNAGDYVFNDAGVHITSEQEKFKFAFDIADNVAAPSFDFPPTIDNAELQEFAFTNLNLEAKFYIDNKEERTIKVGDLLSEAISALIGVEGLGEKNLTIGAYPNGLGLVVGLKGRIDLYDNDNTLLHLYIKDMDENYLINILYDGAADNGTGYVDLSGINFPSVKMSGINLSAIINNILYDILGDLIEGDMDDGGIISASPEVRKLFKEVYESNEYAIDGTVSGGVTSGDVSLADEGHKMNYAVLFSVIGGVIDRFKVDNEKGEIELSITGEMLDQLIYEISGSNFGIKNIASEIDIRLGVGSEDESDNLGRKYLKMGLTVKLPDDVTNPEKPKSTSINIELSKINFGFVDTSDIRAEIDRELEENPNKYADIYTFDNIYVNTELKLDLNIVNGGTIDLNKIAGSFLGDILFALNLTDLDSEIILGIEANIGLEDGDKDMGSDFANLMTKKLGKFEIKLTVKVVSKDKNIINTINIYYDGRAMMSDGTEGGLFLNLSGVGLPDVAIPLSVEKLLEGIINGGDSEENPPSEPDGPVEILPPVEDDGNGEESAVDIMSIIVGALSGISISSDGLAIIIADGVINAIAEQFGIFADLPTLKNGSNIWLKLQSTGEGLSFGLDLGIDLPIISDGKEEYTTVGLALTLTTLGAKLTETGKDKKDILASDLDEYPELSISAGLDGILNSLNSVQVELSVSFRGGLAESTAENPHSLSDVINSVLNIVMGMDVVDYNTQAILAKIKQLNAVVIAKEALFGELTVE